MTTAKIITRMVDFGPTVLKNYTKTPNHCIAATAVGVSVLVDLGVEAYGLSVRMALANKVWSDDNKRREGQPMTEADAVRLQMAGGWVLDTNPSGSDDDVVDPEQWPGHVVIYLPHHGDGGFIDLNFGQFNRPAKNIRVPAAASFHFPTGGRWRYELPGGCQMVVEARTHDTTWQDCPDWQRRATKWKDAIRDLTRAVRKGRL